MHSDISQADPARVLTIEAYADTIVPGAKRGPDDHAVAGVVAGGGAVAAGALELLLQPGGGLAESLDALTISLNHHAAQYAQAHELDLADALPAFVALPFEHRTALVQQLTSPEHPEKEMWVALALFSNMAFDSAAHMSTADAFQQRHPGLLTLGYFPPDEDGLFRFPQHTYGRQLSPVHPDTTTKGDPA